MTCRQLAASVFLVIVGACDASHAQVLQQSQADAAAQMVVLGVQQGISALPPSSGQAISYEFDAAMDAFVRTKRLGPTAFRSPETLPAGSLNLRVAASHFKLEEDFPEIAYGFVPDLNVDQDVESFTRFGLSARADVSVLAFAASYGLTKRLEIELNVPLVIVDPSAEAEFVTFKELENAEDPIVASDDSIDALDQAIEDDFYVKRSESFEALGLNSFHEGTNVGMGRASAGAKVSLFGGKRFQLGASGELFFPSPNEDQLSGSDKFSVLPRVLGGVRVTNLIRLYTDLGYDIVVDQAELRRLVWSFGVSASTQRVSFDLGVSGSEYDKGIRWTPTVATVLESPGGPTLGFWRKQPGENNQLGTTAVDVVFGVKLRVWKGLLLSAVLSVPVDDTQFRPDVAGTAAVEWVQQ